MRLKRRAVGCVSCANVGHGRNRVDWLFVSTACLDAKIANYYVSLEMDQPHTLIRIQMSATPRSRSRSPDPKVVKAGSLEGQGHAL